MFVIGISWSTSRRLADQVDTLVLYDIDVDPPAPSEAAAPSAAPTAEPAQDRTSADNLDDIIRAIEEIIQNERKAGGNPLLTSIKQRLVRRYPEFDVKKLGFSGFKRLMARVSQNGNVRLITAGLVDWAIMADEDIPEGATEATFSTPNARPGRRRGRLPRSRQQEEIRQPEPVSSTDDDTSLVEDTETDHEPVPAFTANGKHDDRDSQSEYSPGPDDGEATAFSSPFGDDTELAQALRDAISGLGMPTEPDDGMLADRVSDLILMANTLEHQEGISHVAFNFLVSEICDALSQGLEAGNADITHRWGQSSSRTYVSKILRGLSDGEFFIKGNHSWRDDNSGQNRRRRTFNLNQDHPLVRQTIAARLGAGAVTSTATATQESYTSVDQDEPPESLDTREGTENAATDDVAESPEQTESTNFEDEDEDYESGKSAAEARIETGFMSRLFSRPRRR